MVAPELIESADEDGFTPLHLAVIQGNLQLVNLLLANGADVNALDNEGHSVVHWATGKLRQNSNFPVSYFYHFRILVLHSKVDRELRRDGRWVVKMVHYHHDSIELVELFSMLPPHRAFKLLRFEGFAVAQRRPNARRNSGGVSGARRLARCQW